MNEPTLLEIGTAKRNNGDGTFSIKLQIDNVPNERLAEAIGDWLFDILSEELERAIAKRRGTIQ